ncbi:hypothetical protein M2302_002262 [Micromonospora sp. A200]|uniref:hypothetical protein n=1 Tax=Micromonospora sp. A200 TaxID=2940568 RepID=UPI00247540A7|nr:hypothetical protein [Micromonospora sp. A200]MDH6462087.1 hypothetical protein [Micromonospora sp. A200]
MAKCTVESSQGKGCRNDALKPGGICGGHTSRLRRHGDVLADVPLRHYTKPESKRLPTFVEGDTEEERFWNRVDRTGDCWIWTGADVKGQGIATLYGVAWTATRTAWTLTYGRPEANQKVVSCSSAKLCVRPDHLSLKTMAKPQRTIADRSRRRHGLAA